MAVFRVEKRSDFTVMSNHHLRNRTLSLKAKGLLSLMLSLPENWDYTMAGLAHICRDGLTSIRAAVLELEEQGYLRRRRLRNEKGQLTDTEYTILERPEPPEHKPDPDPADSPELPPSPACGNRTLASPPDCGFPTLDTPALDFPARGNPAYGNHTQLNIQPSSTQVSSTESSNIHPINPSRDAMDGMDSAAVWKEYLRDNVEYDALAERYGCERLDEILELMLEVLLSRRAAIRIAGDEFPTEAVKSRLLKIGPSHVEYVFDCLDRNTTQIRNIKAYLLTALYNAPATMDSFYRAEVNHDLYGGGAV